MRRWLVIGGFACLVGLGLWLALRSQRPAPGSAPAPAPRAAAPAPARTDYPTPGEPPAGASGPGPAAADDRLRPHRGKSLVPQFDPFLDQLAEAALAGNLEKAAAENGIRLKGDQVRVVIRPTLGDGDKVRNAVKALGGEVVRTVERGDSEPILVAWVPARSLRILAENQAVRNLHRPVGIHANEAPERPASPPGVPGPTAP
jgi:hypothetical protein